MTIARSAEGLAVRHGEAAAGAQLVVAADDQAVVARDGVVIAVLPPGTHVLPAASELWFVRVTPFRGIAFGGSLGTIVDAPTKVACEVRCFGELAVTAQDPARLVVACLGQGTGDGLLGWVKQVAVQQLGDGLAHLARDGASLVARDLVPQVQSRVSPDFAQIGLAFGGFGALTISLSEESIAALKQVAAPKRTLQGATAAAARCPACAKPHGGGKFCGECGAPVAAA